MNRARRGRGDLTTALCPTASLGDGKQSQPAGGCDERATGRGETASRATFTGLGWGRKFLSLEHADFPLAAVAGGEQRPLAGGGCTGPTYTALWTGMSHYIGVVLLLIITI